MKIKSTGQKVGSIQLEYTIYFSMWIYEYTGIKSRIFDTDVMKKICYRNFSSQHSSLLTLPLNYNW